jgi:hypothetical protein
MPTSIEYGLLTYDVPVTQRTVYNRLRKKIRSKTIALNWSAYLIPWGKKKEIEDILSEINSQNPNVIESGVYKFDSSQSADLEKAAQRGLRQLMKHAHDQMRKKLEEAEKNHEDTKKSIEAALADDNSVTPKAELQRIGTLADENLETETKRLLAKAEKSIHDVRGLALTFALTGAMEAVIAGFEKQLEHQKELIAAKKEAGVEKAPEVVKAN